MSCRASHLLLLRRMLTRLLQHCVREVALDGEEGSDVERLFSFVEAFCAHLP